MLAILQPNFARKSFLCKSILAGILRSIRQVLFELFILSPAVGQKQRKNRPAPAG